MGEERYMYGTVYMYQQSDDMGFAFGTLAER